MKRYTVKDILAGYTRGDVIHHAKKYHQTYKEALQAFKAGAELTAENYHNQRQLFTNRWHYKGGDYMYNPEVQLDMFQQHNIRNLYRKDIKNGHRERWEEYRELYPVLFYFIVSAKL